KRIYPHRLGNVLELGLTEIAYGQIKPGLYLAIGVFGETDSAGLGDSLQSRGDIDAVAHQVAIALFDHIAQMNANAKFDAALGRHASITFKHAALNLDCTAYGVDHAAELDECSVAGAFDHAPMMHRDGRIDQIAA